MTDNIIEAWADEIYEATRPVEGSYFKAVGNSILRGHGTVEDVMTYELEDDITVTEFRSKEDKRGRLDVTNEGNFYDWMREYAGSDVLPGIFRKDGSLIRVPSIGEAGWEPPKTGEDDGPAQVRGLNPGALQDIIQHRFWPYREKVDLEKDKKTEEVKKKRIIRTHAIVPRTTVSLAIDGASEWKRVPQVVSVSHTPTLREDGTFIKEPGYDSPSGVLYLPDNGLRPLEMPKVGELNEDWVRWAKQVIDDIIQDFPFELPGHRANYISLLITPLIRRVVPPPYPMFALNAHQRGTGKSLLAKIARTVHGGIHRPEMPTDDDELRKQFTSILTTTTAPLVNFDNSTQMIRSGQLANLLTTNIWSDRPLGSTATVEAANDRIWMVTGNNIVLGGDMARRTQWVSIDAKTKNPEYRTGFAIPNLPDYVEKNRGTIVTALMVLAGWWVQNGMPYRQVRTDDYDRWAGCMTELLNLAGMGTGFGAREAIDMEESEDELELRAFIDGVWDIYGGGEWTVTDLKTTSYNPSWSDHVDAILPSSCKERKDPWKSLGSYCKRHKKQFAGDKRLILVSTGGRTLRWKIENIAS